MYSRPMLDAATLRDAALAFAEEDEGAVFEHAKAYVAAAAAGQAFRITSPPNQDPITIIVFSKMTEELMYSAALQLVAPCTWLTAEEAGEPPRPGVMFSINHTKKQAPAVLALARYITKSDPSRTSWGMCELPTRTDIQLNGRYRSIDSGRHVCTSPATAVAELFACERTLKCVQIIAGCVRCGTLLGASNRADEILVGLYKWFPSNIDEVHSIMRALFPLKSFRAWHEATVRQHVADEAAAPRPVSVFDACAPKKPVYTSVPWNGGANIGPFFSAHLPVCNYH